MSRFNPLAGIRCFLTMYNKPGDRELVMNFNPLAGIRCCLTIEKDEKHGTKNSQFQSPIGDSLLSDDELIRRVRSGDLRLGAAEKIVRAAVSSCEAAEE